MSLIEFEDMKDIEDPLDIADFDPKTLAKNLKKVLKDLQQLDKEVNEDLGLVERQ